MKTVTELMVDAYLQGGNDAQGNGLWAISKHEKALKYAQHQVKLFAIPDVIKPLPCHHIWEYNHAMDKHYCRTCGEPE